MADRTTTTGRTASTLDTSAGSAGPARPVTGRERVAGRDRVAGRRAGARLAVVVTVVVAVALAAAFWWAPPMGTDLSAQVARADFFARYGLAPVDLRWYGGVSPPGYSVVSPALMAWLGGGASGAKLAGALAAVASAVLLVLLLLRTAARRPALAGALGAACFAGNLVSGRITYAIGVAFGLAALLAAVPPAARPAPAACPPVPVTRPSTRWRGLRAGGVLAGAALAALTSPVAGLFTGLAGVALLLSGAGARSGRRWRPAGLLLASGAGVPLAVTTALFGSGGWMNISRTDTVHAVLTSVGVAVLVRRPAIRAGALLSALGVLAAFLVHTPVGLNATRLATMFALPVLAGYADPLRGLNWSDRRRLLPAAGIAAVLALAAWWQPPVLRADLADAGNPAASPEFFAPLSAELARRAPVGRIEVVPTRDYWEAAYAAAAVPLARGWLRQADLAYHPLFFDGTLTADRYHSWLLDNGVSYVALADTELSWVGRAEAALVRAGLPYLAPVWQGGGWVLYRVAGDPSVVDGARLVASAADRVTLDVAGAGEVLVRVRFSRWLDVRGPAGARLAPQGRWTVLRVDRPGRYTVTG